MGKAGPCTSTGTFTSLSMVTDLRSSRTGSSGLTLSGLLELSKGVRRELSTAFLESPAEPFLGPSRDFTYVDTWGEVKSKVHSSSTCSTSKHAKLLETGKGETTATFFLHFRCFLFETLNAVFKYRLYRRGRRGRKTIVQDANCRIKVRIKSDDARIIVTLYPFKSAK